MFQYSTAGCCGAGYVGSGGDFTLSDAASD
jgi:hypothetical protein